MILKGVGELFTYVKNDTGFLVPKLLGARFNTLKMDFKVDLEAVYGGDGLFKIDSFVKNKEIDISVENAEFDLSQLAIILGANVTVADTGAEVWVMGEVIKPTAAVDPATTTSIDLAFKSTAVAGSLAARYRDGSGDLEVVADASGVTAAGKIALVSGAVTLFTDTGSADIGKDIVLYYKRTVTADTVPIMINDEPMVLGVIQQSKFRQKDNTVQGLEVEIFAAQPYGTFSLENKRRTASSHSLQLAVQDADRADGMLGTVKRYVA